MPTSSLDRKPITVALVDDYDVVVIGVANILQRYSERVVVAEIDTTSDVADPVDIVLYDSFAFGMHARGAMPEPDSREPWFICEAHADADIIDRVLTAFEESLHAALEDRSGSGIHVTPHGGMASPGAG